MKYANMSRNKCFCMNVIISVSNHIKQQHPLNGHTHKQSSRCIEEFQKKCLIIEPAIVFDLHVILRLSI